MTLIASIKRTLRAKRENGSATMKMGIRCLDFTRGVVRRCWVLAFDRRYRAMMVLKWTDPQRVHQTTPLTCMDRYPQIFAACRDLFADRPAIRILSFGCSTGEEVISLRRYFPDAYIVGAEINPESLALCLKQPVDGRMSFVVSDPATISQQGPFDLIFCMAVLQRTPRSVETKRMASLKKLYPFEKFDLQVQELDSYLRDGGVLVIHLTQYFFRDSSVASKYETLDAGHFPAGYVPSYDRNSMRVDGVDSGGSIFKKIRQ